MSEVFIVLLGNVDGDGDVDVDGDEDGDGDAEPLQSA